ncbi:DUF1611 domain-containing protein [Mucisphaera calidilacus]|uniref:DUF1611 domain-containing protein n=1 Tax=Mucisphaera calidilacus TaxID=2527982 RepID=A0A518C025_9BACT|nr:DUF1611 domain-containing protein [Mucisphaera calidilacus]QDU72576.1 hypothetical protein Pan265_24460 [Mucisphaera calidilacus]
MAQRIVLLTEGHTSIYYAKTAYSVLRYRAEEVVALLDTQEVGKTAGGLLGVGGDVPVVGDLGDVPDADTLIIGIGVHGGKLPEVMRGHLLKAVERGMTVISGLHEFLSDDADLAAAAEHSGAHLWDVRKNHEHEVAEGRGFEDGCYRLHTVGQDCSVGKMIVSVEVSRALAGRGLSSKFVATGQTGIMVEGDGTPIDTVVADFINGAAEKLVLRNQHHDVMCIEGQGSILHPSYSSVTLGLLHGCRPDGLILCYEAGRTHVKGLDHIALKSLETYRALYESLASEMHPCRVVGVGMNSRRLDDAAFEAEKRRVGEALGLPVADVVREGAGVLADAVERAIRDRQPR